MNGAIERLLSVLFCKRCAICGRIIGQEEEICSLCRADLPTIGSNICPFCGRDRANCVCEGDEFAFDGAAAPFYYGGKARHLIHQLKFYGQRELTPLLAVFMETRVKEAFPSEQFDLIVPVPMHRSERREREYNHSALLGKELSRRLGIPLREKAITKVRETKRQRGLPAGERRTNLSGAFSACLPDWAKTILLVDDVLTTGSTAGECAKALKKAGAQQVYCITCAATVLEHGNGTKENL
ncbi:ComF family protein [Zongyangia sp. HA2173]|uniref:double zinc ribbon domain-containing protein n=1 Tax=Zongyangia sp. HA2173 TaxID=3133035 RepID=UPI00174C2E0C